MTILDADGNAILENLIVDDGSERDVELMGNDRLTLRFSLPSYVTFSSRCYCYFQGVRYTMYIPAEVKKVNTMCYDYVVTMHTHAYELRLTQMKDLYYSNNQYSGGERVTFPYTAKAAEHVAMVVNCMNKADGTRLWRYVIGTDVLEAMREKLIVYDKVKCSDALIAIAEAYETEYEVNDDYDTITETTWRTITLHRVESHKGSQSLGMEYGKGKGFKSGVVRRTQVSVPPVDVLYVQGGSHNIDKTDYGNDTLLLPSNRYTVYYGYLNGANQMYIEYKATPTSTSVWYDAEGNRMDYIPAIGGFAIYKISNDKRSIYRVTDAEDGTPYRPTNVEEVYDGSEVYPSRVGVVSHVKVTPRSTEDGEPYNLYDIYDETFGTNSNAPSPDYRDACLVDETMTVIFQDGMLAGREFAIQTSGEGTEVQAVMNWDSTLQEWGIPLSPSEEDSMILPNETFAPAIGDHYAVFHCKLPSAYIRVAEFTLLHQAVDWLYNNSEIEYTADGEVDEKWIMADSARSDRMAIGECISLRDTEMFGLGLQMRITGLRQNVNAPWRYSITMDNRPRTLYDWTRMLEKTVRDANEYKATLSPNEQLMPKYRQYKAKSGGGSGGGGGVVMQVNSDWNATSGVAEILNKPDLDKKQNVLTAGRDIEIKEIVEVEYLESSGTQLMDTGIVVGETDTILCSAMFLNKSGDNMLFGVSGSSGEGGIWHEIYGNTTYYTRFGSSTPTSKAAPNPHGRHEYELRKGYLGVDGVQFLSLPFTNMPSGSLKIFGRDSTYKFVGRIYSLSVRNENGDAIIDFIPVRVGQVGYMYDRVSGKLFGNNAGTGEFIIGQDVDIHNTIVDYVGESIIPLEDNGTTTAGVWLAKSDKVTEYVDGALYMYKITKAGASTTTLNINGLGAKTVHYQPGSLLTTHFPVGVWLLLFYRGGSGVFVVINNYNSDSNSIPGVYCATTATAAAKYGTLSTHDANLKAAIDGGPMYLTVCMYYTNTKAAALTLNVDSSGAKPIYINGEPSSATNHTLPAGMYFVYWDGEHYQFRTDGKLTINGVVFGGSYNDLADKPTIGDVGMVRCIYKNTGSTAQSLVLVNTSQAAKVEYLAVDGEEVPRNEIDAGVSSKTLNPSETVTVDIVFAPVTGRMPWRNGVFPSGVLASVAYITELVIPSGMAFVDENTFGSALTKVWCIGSVPAHFSAIMGTGITVMVPAAFDGVYRSEYGTGVLITTY